MQQLHKYKTTAEVTMPFAKLFFLIAVLGFSFSAQANNKYQISDLLMKSFGSACRSVGTYSNASLSHTQSLISFVKSLQSDPDCNQTEGLMDTLFIFETHLRDLQHPSERSEIFRLEQEVESLTVSMDQTADADLEAALASQLVTSRLDLISARSTYHAYRKSNKQNRKVEGYYSALSALRNMITSMPTLERCYNGNVQRMSQLFGNGLGVASYFVNPALSAALAGTSAIITSAVDMYKQLQMERAISNTSQAILPTALSCSAEVLMDSYCDSIEAERVIKQYATDYINKTSGWSGINLVMRELKPLIDWVDLVRAGSPALDAFDADRRIEIVVLDNFLRKLKPKMEGYEAATEDELGSLPASINLSDFLQGKITIYNNLLMSGTASSSLMFNTSTPEQTNPILQIVRREILVFKLLGFAELPKCGLGDNIRTCNDFQDYVKNASNGSNGTQTITFDLSDWNEIKRNADQVNQDAREYVNSRLSKVLNHDPASLLVQAFDNYPGLASAFQIVEALIHYGAEVKAYLTLSNQSGEYWVKIRNIDKTMEMLQTLRKTLTNWLGDSQNLVENTRNAKSVVKEIFDLLRLEHGERYLLDRLNNIVKWDVASHINNNEFDQRMVEIAQISNTELISDLTSYGMFDLQEVLADVQNSKSIMKSTLGAYYNTMAIYFARAFRLIEKNKLSPGVKAKLCVHLLGSQLFERSKGYRRQFMRACKGTALESIYRADHSVKFDDFITSEGKYLKDFDTRQCLYYNFIRKNKLIEKFKPVFRPQP